MSKGENRKMEGTWVRRNECLSFTFGGWKVLLHRDVVLHFQVAFSGFPGSPVVWGSSVQIRSVMVPNPRPDLFRTTKLIQVQVKSEN